MASTVKDKFDWIDFSILGVFLSISVGIGAYHAWKSRLVRLHQTSETAATDEFLMGGRKMPVLPVALSLLTTFLSGIVLLGTPAEIYQKGFVWWFYYMTATTAFVSSFVFFIPIFFKFRATSIYEYFEYRYDSRLIRQLCAALFLCNTIFYMSIVLYAPSVALSGVTDLPIWPFILIVGLTCTLYTSIGGLKAVVWTDTLQAAFMYGGLVTLITKGIHDSGGVEEVFRRIIESKRLDSLTRFDPNPAQHNSIWISLLGGWAFWTTLYGLNQMSLQRYCSMPSMKQVKIVFAITLPAYVLLASMSCFNGLLMLAYFYGCDPITNREFDNRDQLVIRFATRVLGSVPGLPGLFLATLMSGTLSTISSGMNSMAAVMWEDFLKRKLHSRVSDDTAAGVNKFLVCLFGVVATGLAFAAQPLGGIIRASISIMGAMGGPLVGLFCLGVLVPKSNKVSAYAGLIISTLIMLWICISGFIYSPFENYSYPGNTSGCDGNNKTIKEIHLDDHYGDRQVPYIYRMSEYLYPFIGLLITLLVGVPVSYLVPTRWLVHDEETKRRYYSLTFAGRHEPFHRHHPDTYNTADQAMKGFGIKTAATTATSGSPRMKQSVTVPAELITGGGGQTAAVYAHNVEDEKSL